MNVRTEPYADIEATARTLMAGDCTVTRYGRPLMETRGYVVGGACPVYRASTTRRDVDALLVRDIAIWIQAQPSNVVLFGSWADDDIVYFDGCTYVADYDDAVALGAERGERCIWSITTGRVIKLSERQRYSPAAMGWYATA